MACRDKCIDCDNDEGQLEPPFGVVASAVGGELTFFDLQTLDILLEERQQGWSTACELLPIGNRFFSADNESGVLSIYQLPDFEQVESLPIGGTPIDLSLDRTLLSVHLITRNGQYYRIPFSSMEADTTETGQFPRRIRFRPPSDHHAWIPCSGDSAVHIIEMQGFYESASIKFPAVCTDVCFSSNGEFAFCAVPGASRLFKLNAATHEFVDTLSLFTGTTDLAISDDGRYMAAVDSAFGNVRIWDHLSGGSATLRCGTQAIRVRYSATRGRFFVICPQEAWLLCIDPGTSPPQVTDTMFVASIPQCISFSE